jgi:hypothetical protein
VNSNGPGISPRPRGTGTAHDQNQHGLPATCSAAHTPRVVTVLRRPLWSGTVARRPTAIKAMRCPGSGGPSVSIEWMARRARRGSRGNSDGVRWWRVLVVVGNGPVVLLQLRERKVRWPIWKKTRAGAKLTEEGNNGSTLGKFVARGGGAPTTDGGHKVEGRQGGFGREIFTKEWVSGEGDRWGRWRPLL